MLGQTLNNRYKITAHHRRGAMGDVYQANDIQTGQTVAVKVLTRQLSVDEHMVERFRREGEALRQLRHPNIVEFVDTFQREGQQVIVMEYVRGGNLHELIQQGPLPIERARRIALEVCDALTRTHHLDIVHRDIKPENILIAEDGTPRLTDFGVARLVGEGTRLTGTGTQVGTPYYMPPEAWEGQTLDTQADIWSLGVVLYEMLSGKVPFDGETLIAVMNKVLSAPLPELQTLRADVPDGLVQIVTSMLTRDKAARYQTIREVAADLERGQPLKAPPTHRLQRAEEQAATPAAPPAEAAPSPRRALRWLLRTSGTVLAVVAAVLTILFLLGSFGTSALLERTIAGAKWEEVSPGSQTTITEAEAAQDLEAATRLYLPGSLEDVRLDFAPPNRISVQGTVFGRETTLECTLTTVDGMIDFSIVRVGGVRPFLVGNILSGGINRGLKAMLVDHAVTVEQFEIGAESLTIAYGGEEGSVVALTSPTATLSPMPSLPSPSSTPKATSTSSPTLTPTAIPDLRWQRMYPGTDFDRAEVRAMAIDPLDSDVAYAGTDGAGLYKTYDGGNSWIPSHAGLGRAAIDSIAISPDDPQTMFAGVLPAGVYRSEDGGATWSASSTGIAPAHGGGQLSQVVFDPTERHRLYYAHSEGVWVSQDGGESWSLLSEPPCGVIAQLVPHPQDSSILYLSTYAPEEAAEAQCGIFRSEDGGRTWEASSQTLTFAEGWLWTPRLTINPANSQHLYVTGVQVEMGKPAGQNIGSARSTNGGQSWWRLPYYCSSIIPDPENLLTLYCPSSIGLDVSYDGGETWEALALRQSVDGRNFLVVSADRDIWYAFGDTGGVARSTNNNALGWEYRELASSGIGNLRQELFVDPLDSSFLYISVDGNRRYGTQFRSTDGGRTWDAWEECDQCSDQVDFEPRTGELLRFAQDLTGGEQGGAGCTPALARSSNHGLQWEWVYDVLPHRTCTVDEWSYQQVLINPQDANRWYVLTDADPPLFVSQTAGEYWEHQLEGYIVPNSRLLAHPDDQVIYLVGGEVSFRSDDAGDTWQVLDAAPAETLYRPRAAVVSPVDPDVLYVGHTTEGIYRTTDGGQSFELINTGLTNLSVNTLAIDPADPQLLYAGTDDGAFISFDGGDHWNVINDGLLGAAVIYSIAIDPNDADNVYAATPYGIFKLETR